MLTTPRTKAVYKIGERPYVPDRMTEEEERMLERVSEKSDKAEKMRPEALRVYKLTREFGEVFGDLLNDREAMAKFAEREKRFSEWFKGYFDMHTNDIEIDWMTSCYAGVHYIDRDFPDEVVYQLVLLDQLWGIIDVE